MAAKIATGTGRPSLKLLNLPVVERRARVTDGTSAVCASDVSPIKAI